MGDVSPWRCTGAQLPPVQLHSNCRTLLLNSDAAKAPSAAARAAVQVVTNCRALQPVQPTCCQRQDAAGIAARLRERPSRVELSQHSSPIVTAATDAFAAGRSLSRVMSRSRIGCTLTAF